MDVDIGYLTKLMEETFRRYVKKMFADRGFKDGRMGIADELALHR